MVTPYYKSLDRSFTLVQGDCLEILSNFEFQFDMIFADPPYFLSNGGISVQSGKIVCVDKGSWDKAKDGVTMDQFNFEWLKLCRDKLKDSGSIWVSGTYHNIFNIAEVLKKLNYKILNVITWVKTNPPPNISCRYFTYSTEFIIWARKSFKVPHKYNYKLMKSINNGKQMTDVWRMSSIARWEKEKGKHPTQKPISLLSRIILSCTNVNDWILDPFAGSSTTGIASTFCNRRFLGIEKEKEFVEISKARRIELDDPAIRYKYSKKIPDLAYIDNSLFVEEENAIYGNDLSF